MDRVSRLEGVELDPVRSCFLELHAVHIAHVDRADMHDLLVVFDITL